MAIKILSQNTINRIAAGEVIERPASAVKELVENSIDAGARSVGVRIENGGRNFISVTDDGCGMNREDLDLCVERHATSKLQDDNLFNILNFGFRGEALPSIASVSRMEITSRAEGADTAYMVKIEGGKKYPLQPASLQKGTKIEIRDLFFATPARLKFLKTERTETGHITETINRLAMAYPEVSFTLLSEHKNLLKLPAGQGDLLGARQVRLGQILGKEFAENSVPVNADRGDITITGLAGLPTFNKRTSVNQYVFVNNRPVRDKLFLGAIRAAYQDFLSYDRHPVVVLFLEIPTEEVDVNVHPAKLEVRFRDSNHTRHMIVSALKVALTGAGHRASNTVSAQAIAKMASGIGGIVDARDTGGAANISYKTGYGSRGYYNKSVSQSQFGDKSGMDFQAPLNRSLDRNLDRSGANIRELFGNNVPAPASRNHEQDMSELYNEQENIEYPLGAAKCQLHETYIVSQTKGGIIIVDQHAAHERIVYEKMKVAMQQQEGVRTQPLLIPEVVDLQESDVTILLEKISDLAKFGLVIEQLSDKSILVREVPEILKKPNVKSLIKNLADDLHESGELLSLSGAIEHVCGTIACHGSIRAGRCMSIHEMNALLREIESTPHTGQCNHGRPTYVELKLNDIEKLFGRK